MQSPRVSDSASPSRPAQPHVCDSAATVALQIGKVSLNCAPRATDEPIMSTSAFFSLLQAAGRANKCGVISSLMLHFRPAANRGVIEAPHLASHESECRGSERPPCAIMDAAHSGGSASLKWTAQLSPFHVMRSSSE